MTGGRMSLLLLYQLFVEGVDTEPPIFGAFLLELGIDLGAIDHAEGCGDVFCLIVLHQPLRQLGNLAGQKKMDIFLRDCYLFHCFTSLLPMYLRWVSAMSVWNRYRSTNLYVFSRRMSSPLLMNPAS